MLSQNYPSLIEALPANIREPVLDAISTLQIKVAEHIENVLQSEETFETISGFVNEELMKFCRREFRKLLMMKHLCKLSVFSKRGFVRSFKNRHLKKRSKILSAEALMIWQIQKLRSAEMFTNDAIGLLKEKAEEQIEPIVHQLAEIATAERTRNQISALIKQRSSRLL